MGSYRVSGIVALSMTASSAMSGTATITSQAFDISSYESFAFQPNWTGTPAGSFKVLVSIDGTTYIDLGASVSGNPAGTASGCYIPVFACCAKYVKLQYTNASGAGTLSGSFFGKTR